MTTDDRKPRCVECGQTKDGHHAFMAPNPPAMCACDPEDWSGQKRIPDICDCYAGDPRYPGTCATCQHEEPCHPKAEKKNQP